MHDNSRFLFRQYAAKHFASTSRVLEIGPNFESRLSAPYSTWHTAGLSDDPRLDYRCEEYHIPVPAESYDIVFSSNVIEHVRKPWVWLPELTRVCVSGGLVITICPVNWPYHKDPVDCWRIYPEGMRALYADSGLEVVECLAMYGELSGDHEKAWFPYGGRTLDTICVGRKP
jgi:SAM-dependent methyltransferase